MRLQDQGFDHPLESNIATFVSGWWREYNERDQREAGHQWATTSVAQDRDDKIISVLGNW